MKDLEWLKEEIRESMHPHNLNGKSWQDVEDNLIGLIEQVEQPEKLNEDWIHENEQQVHEPNNAWWVESEDLKRLVADVQPEVPELVGKWIDSTIEWTLYEIFDEDYLYTYERDIAKWLYDNVEEVNREKENIVVKARAHGFTIVPEKLYTVEDRHGNYLLTKVDGGVGSSVRLGDVVVSLKGLEEGTLLLTEKEIKDFDETYFAFAKPFVEGE